MVLVTFWKEVYYMLWLHTEDWRHIRKPMVATHTTATQRSNSCNRWRGDAGLLVWTCMDLQLYLWEGLARPVGRYGRRGWLGHTHKQECVQCNLISAADSVCFVFAVWYHDTTLLHTIKLCSDHGDDGWDHMIWTCKPFHSVKPKLGLKCYMICTQVYECETSMRHQWQGDLVLT